MTRIPTQKRSIEKRNKIISKISLQTIMRMIN